MFDWSLLDDPNCPEFERVEDGPFRQPFLIPCPIQGPNCCNVGGAYRIDRRNDSAGKGENLFPDGGTGQMRIGKAGFDFTFGCPNCRKHVHVAVARDSARDRGRELRASLETRINDAGIPKRYRALSLSRCRDRRGKEIPTLRAVDTTYVLDDISANAISWLRSWDGKGSRSGALIGAKGTGKSHITYAWAMDRIRLGDSVYVLREKRLQSALQAGYDSAEYRQARQAIEHAATARVLVWDDLAHVPDGYQDRLPERLVREIDYLVDQRYSEQRAILLTTNAGWPALQKRLGDGPVSRLQEMTGSKVFQMGGFDWRTIGTE